MSLGPICPLVLSGAGVRGTSITGVTLLLGDVDCPCLACWNPGFTAVNFFGDLPTTAVRTKKRTAMASPPPSSMSLPLLMPSIALASARVAKFLEDVPFSLLAEDSGLSTEACAVVGSGASTTVVGSLPVPFLLLSAKLMVY
jgi:hypothetical protein